jgi:hypothetical protein
MCGVFSIGSASVPIARAKRDFVRLKITKLSFIANSVGMRAETMASIARVSSLRACHDAAHLLFPDHRRRAAKTAQPMMVSFAGAGFGQPSWASIRRASKKSTRWGVRARSCPIGFFRRRNTSSAISSKPIVTDTLALGRPISQPIAFRYRGPPAALASATICSPLSTIPTVFGSKSRHRSSALNRTAKPAHGPTRNAR